MYTFIFFMWNRKNNAYRSKPYTLVDLLKLTSDFKARDYTPDFADVTVRDDFRRQYLGKLEAGMLTIIIPPPPYSLCVVDSRGEKAILVNKDG